MQEEQVNSTLTDTESVFRTRKSWIYVNMYKFAKLSVQESKCYLYFSMNTKQWVILDKIPWNSSFNMVYGRQVLMIDLIHVHFLFVN